MPPSSPRSISCRVSAAETRLAEELAELARRAGLPSQPGLAIAGRHYVGGAVRELSPPLRRLVADSLVRNETVRHGRWLSVPLRRPLPAALVWSGQASTEPWLPLWHELTCGELLPNLLADAPLLALAASSPSLRLPLELLDRVAHRPLNVLLLGETGTGKELVARALHAASQREGPFVAENCAALPEGLVEAELFGVRRGAFTGADTDRQGLFLLANEGTLLLDEIGELALSAQAKLLRVLQQREVRPVGGADTLSLTARLVAATQDELPAQVEKRRFRADLYFRLAGLTVLLPPLRERVQDLPYLTATLFARLEDEGYGVGLHLDERAHAALAQREFPGNVRELDNALRHGAALAETPRIRERDLPTDVFASNEGTPGATETLLAALAEANGNKAVAARRLGWSRSKLYRRLALLDQDSPSAISISRSRSCG